MSELAASLRRSIPADPSAPSAARKAVKDFLGSNGADPGALADVLLAVSEAVTNCVVHAYRGQPGGTVDLEARRTGDRLLLSVTDDGTGMSPRVDSPGLGLGLPLVGRIAERVDITAQAGGGTVVSMSFDL